MVSILKKDKQDAYGIRHFVADEEKDIPTISTISLNPGSTVFIIDNSKTYMLNSSKLWIKINTSASGGVSPEGDYDGGVIKPIPPGLEFDGGQVKRR